MCARAYVCVLRGGGGGGCVCVCMFMGACALCVCVCVRGRWGGGGVDMCIHTSKVFCMNIAVGLGRDGQID